ncbi:MAG: hypothetical protein LH485_01640 [Sphingomonas bacterium]|nr:hypothetical protein [Sphingomonas bacterium]
MAAARPANPPSPIAEGGFPLTGPSELPDPATHAYRQDLADVALAGRVVASHYAEPLVRHIATGSPFLTAADDVSAPVGTLVIGDELRILDISRGWAWGYGPGGRVGYVRSEFLVA